jgi:hypothetical protein
MIGDIALSEQPLAWRLGIGSTLRCWEDCENWIDSVMRLLAEAPVLSLLSACAYAGYRQGGRGLCAVDVGALEQGILEVTYLTQRLFREFTADVAFSAEYGEWIAAYQPESQLLVGALGPEDATGTRFHLIGLNPQLSAPFLAPPQAYEHHRQTLEGETPS